MLVSGLARAVIVGLFGVAALAKLVDRPGTVRGLRTFGVERHAATVWWSLPAAELAVAATTLADPTARAGAAAGVALLVVFSVLAARLIRRGTTASCNCFGSTHDTPIGPGLLVRNAVFVVAGVVVAVGPETHWWTGLGDLPAAGRTGIVFAVAAAVVAVGTAAAAGTGRRAHAEVARRLAVLEAEFDRVAPVRPVATKPAPSPGLPIGVLAPRFELPQPSGAPFRFGDPPGSGRPTLLVFLSGGCGGCTALLPALGRWAGSAALAVVAVVAGDEQQRRHLVEPIPGVTTAIDAERAVARTYETQWTPAAVLVGGNGRIASRVAYGEQAITALAEYALASAERLADDHVGSAPPPTVDPAGAPGRPLPELARLTGSGVGGPTAVVFWDSACGFCQRLAPSLRAYAATRTVDEPALLVVAPEAVDLGDDVATAVDPERALSAALGVAGTPSAVLVGADGTVRSDVVAGAPLIAMLLGDRLNEPQPVLVPAPTFQPAR